ncbi:MAG TPA: hypothetical protein VH025_01715 [Solirubrobacteraceae bacterium]|nr:hypothetical protein [Solirubrobacteraceae bacterium]
MRPDQQTRLRERVVGAIGSHEVRRLRNDVVFAGAVKGERRM